MSYRVKNVRHVMGTFFTITIVHPDPGEANKALLAAFDEIYRINDLMSIHKESSEISILNREGFYKGVSADTRYVIQRAKHFSELSGGVFDVTILPVLKLWEERAGTNKVFTDAEIGRTSELVNHRNIVIEGNDIRFNKAGMGITVAGVAKGYAVDRAIEVLRQGNIRHALVNAGGDIRAIGGKTDAASWKIAVRDPQNTRRLITTVELCEQAIATSGAYHRPFNDIINPKSGKPVQEVLSSTVITKKAIDADILATCLFILGAERGQELIRRLDGVRALVITRDGSILELA